MKNKMLYLLAPLFAPFLFTGTAFAELDAAALKKQIMERSSNIEEFRALLNDPNQTVRLAALDAMMKSGDNAMRELAYSVGFNSADQAMRAVALENRIAVMKNIVIDLPELEGGSESQAEAFKDWGSTYSFEISDFDADTGRFVTKGTYRGGAGHVSGTRLEFSQSYCNGQFELGDGAVLNGKLSCKSSWLGDYPGTISLR